MNWKFFIAPILTFLQGRFIALSKADGKDGLTAEDFKIVVARVAKVAKDYKSAKGLFKAKSVASWVSDNYGNVVNDYVIPILVSKAYEYAERKGLLPKK